MVNPLAVLKETAAQFSAHRATRLSAALAYYSVFSLAPLLLIVITVVSAVFGEEAARGELQSRIEGVVGAQAAGTIQSMLDATEKSGATGWVAAAGTLLLLVSASGVFAQLKDALNTVWEIQLKPGRGWRGMLKDRLMSMAMVVTLGFLLLVSLILSATVAALTKYASSLLPAAPWVWQAMSLAVTFGMVAVVFAAIFKILPDAKVRWSDVWIGAVITALLFTLGKFGLGMYLGRAGAVSAYGAAGAAVLLLLWIYYSSLILLFGAELTRAYARARGHRIEPHPDAVRVTEYLQAKEGMVSSKTLKEAARGGAE